MQDAKRNSRHNGQCTIDRRFVANHLFSDPVCHDLYNAWCREQGWYGTTTVDDAKAWIVSKNRTKERAAIVLFYALSSAGLV